MRQVAFARWGPAGDVQTTAFGHEQPFRLHANTSFKEETNMSELRYPNESREYRDARELLLKEEQELVDKVKFVAERRRNLPLGGQLKEDYLFQWANDGKIGKSVKFSELSHGLHARGAARHSHSATKFQVRIFGKKY